MIRGSQTEYRHFISANGRVVAIVKRSAQTGNKKFYLHADHLGSTDVITDETSAVYLRTSHDAWGQRRGGATWSGAPTAPEKTAVNASTHRGYTGHEQLDNLNLVHMKGRVYDPVIARFMSADPIIQSPFRSQSFNRYSYVWNNPLNAVDPTGFCTEPNKEYDHCYADMARGAVQSMRENGQAAVNGGTSGKPLTDAPINSAQRQEGGLSAIVNSVRRMTTADVREAARGAADQMRTNPVIRTADVGGGADVIDSWVDASEGDKVAIAGAVLGTVEKRFGGGLLNKLVPNSIRDRVASFFRKADANTPTSTSDAATASVRGGETALTAAGRRAHQQEPLPEGFERDVRVPGTRLRMDGYNPSTKQVLEIKPDNSRAVARGERQLERYCNACDASELGSGHTSVPVQTYDPSKYLE